jgi:hypothetical protein
MGYPFSVKIIHYSYVKRGIAHTLLAKLFLLKEIIAYFSKKYK